MTDEDKAVSGQSADQQEDTSMLDHMEDTLREMRGDDSFDDVDSLDDAVDTIDQRTDDDPEKKAGEAPAGEQEKDDQDEAPAAEAGPGAAKGDDTAAPADKPAGDDAKLDPAAQDAEDDATHAAITNEKTAARFEQFRTENKEMSGELNELSAAHEELKTASGTLFDYLDESQTTPEQLSAQLALNKAINTGDFEAARPAFARMQEMMRVVAVGLGDPSISDLPLGDELQGQVDSLDITPDLAQKQALMNAQRQLQGQYAQHQQQQQQAQGDDVAMKQQAAAEIKTWEDGLRTSDPDFGGKQGQMLQNAKEIMSTYPPNQWLPALQQQYSIITDAQARMTQQQQKQNVNPTPIRPGAGSMSGGDPVPRSFEENFNQQLRGMRPNAQ